MTTKAFVFLSLALIAAAPTAVAAADLPQPSSDATADSDAVAFQGQRNYRGELLNTPVYDPKTKSYFEMVDGAHGLTKGYNAYEGPTWGQAYDFARQRIFKGARGRLALVKSLETHEFLMNMFHPSINVWIGLRYWCSGKTLQWSDGTAWTAGSFQRWDKEWRQDIYACASAGGPNEYMPIAYSPPPTLDWIGKGWNKRYSYFFVEYPTGAP